MVLMTIEIGDHVGSLSVVFLVTGFFQRAENTIRDIDSQCHFGVCCLRVMGHTLKVLRCAIPDVIGPVPGRCGGKFGMGAWGCFLKGRNCRLCSVSNVGILVHLPQCCVGLGKEGFLCLKAQVKTHVHVCIFCEYSE